jgi:hypothetical protein
MPISHYLYRTAELTSLLNDETAFTKFFESLNAVQTMKKVRDDLRIANEDISSMLHLFIQYINHLSIEKTLALEAEVEQLKKDIASKMHTVNERRASFEQKAQRQQEVMKVLLILSLYSRSLLLSTAILNTSTDRAVS